MRGFDINQKLDEQAAKMFRDHEFEFVVRYVGRRQQADYDLDLAETQTIIAAGLKLAVVQHCENEGWTASKALGAEYGANAAKFAKDIGYAEGCTLYLDLEGIASTCGAQSIIAYCNAWYDEVEAGGYLPGVYVGFDVWLTRTQLYKDLMFQGYWAAYNADVTPAVRGYAMKQGLQINVGGYDIDPDEVCGDVLGGIPVFMTGNESWKAQGAKWLFEKGLTKELHSATETVDIGTLGIILERLGGG
jgi:hypothetical protein